MITGLSSPEQWQKSGESAMQQMLESAEKNMNDAIELMTNNTKTGLDLLEKAFNSRQPFASQEQEARAREMWETTVGAFARNAEMAVQANNRMLESWKKMAEVFTTEDSPNGQKTS
jgi:hypothetical protein